MAVAKVTEIKASSPVSFDAAIKEGIERSHKTLEGIKSAWIQDQEVRVDENGKVVEYRVLMKVTFMVK